jgi:hypothetical protein
MRKGLTLLLAMIFVFSVGVTLAVYGGPGAAPNSGDGTPDGSGFLVNPGPIGDGDSLGPNPLAGDGIPDGSDLDSPNGPAAK